MKDISFKEKVRFSVAVLVLQVVATTLYAVTTAQSLLKDLKV